MLAQPIECGYVSGEAFLARAEVFELVGRFNERYEMYFEDAEWSIRVRRAGWLLEAVPAAVFRHEWGSSLPSAKRIFRLARARVLFYRRAFGLPRSRALWRAAPVFLRETGSYVRRGKVWHALKGELAGTIAGLIASG